ncbi:flap endonuclease Xni [Paraferrimonas sp. SM1919]|uniref:flap endonuclease Xni n=1 Tax=Paraferrimonas sp. SM1919 TaxID=2662263 RepID=UPI0013D28B01|nr:flap endonuclease Xni [Paraferrimonas sp. SM1919]
MNASKQMVIIDALNLIRRIEAVIDSEQPQQLINRVIIALEKVIAKFHPEYIAMVWDGNQDQWRKQLYAEYKADRKPMPESLAQLLPQIKLAIKDIGIFNLECPYEADDTIATLALKANQQHLKVTIISTDKGFYQLLTDGIKIWDYFSQQNIGIEAINFDFKVQPHQLLEYWALAGSPGNKIKGVTGIGKKGASDLLNTYPDLKSIYQNVDKLAPALQNKLSAGKQQAKISYLLVKLKTDLTLGISLRELRL